ncbi:hypothetical protein A2U01_0092855, partial [Trifolium medium]|nr:hypothetical protein [Trifolium medium]
MGTLFANQKAENTRNIMRIGQNTST